MAHPSQARWMAPLALAAALLAVGIVVGSTTGDGGEQGSQTRPPAASTTGTGERTTRTQARTAPATTPRPASTTATTTTGAGESHTVQSGDTLGTIAEETGVSVEELQELNPTVDPQSLTVGQRIRLSR